MNTSTTSPCRWCGAPTPGRPWCLEHSTYAHEVKAEVARRAREKAERLHAAKRAASADRKRPKSREAGHVARAAGRRAAAEAGNLLGRVPLGYRRVGDRVEVDREKADLVVALFKSRAGGASVYAMEGVFGLRQQSIRFLLRSPAYLGLVPWAGEVFQGRHEPIVEAALWEAVNGAPAPAPR